MTARTSVVAIVCAIIAQCATVTVCIADESQKQETIRVACVGDSITFGAGPNNPESYPSQLGAMLGSEWEVRNFGIPGTTLLKKGDAPYWNVQAYKEALAFRPNVVVIKLGTNDSKPQNWDKKGNFVKDYVELIRSFERLATKPKIWICYPVPAYTDGWGINGKVIEREMIPRIKEIAGKTELPVIDLHTALSNKKEMFPDGIHPNAQGAKVMAETICAAITGRTNDVAFPGTKSDYHGFARYDFSVGDRKAIVICPKLPAAGKPWLWRYRFVDTDTDEKSASKDDRARLAKTDLALLGKGYHIAMLADFDTWGEPDAMPVWDAFYKAMAETYKLSTRPAMTGAGDEALMVVRWAATQPTKVSCIYLDKGVCDIKSWPGGKFKGEGSTNKWQEVVRRYRFRSEAEALAWRKNPVDLAASLASARIPIICVAGDTDKTAPMDENAGLLQKRCRTAGGVCEVIVKKGEGHAPYGLDDPAPVVDFILRHTKAK